MEKSPSGIVDAGQPVYCQPRGIYRLVLSLVLIIWTSCDVASTYTIVLRNSTKGRIRDATVKYGDFVSVGGVLNPGIEKMHAGVRQKPPQTGEVGWVTEDGRSFRREVKIPQGVHEIIFEIREDSVVEVRIREDGE